MNGGQLEVPNPKAQYTGHPITWALKSFLHVHRKKNRVGQTGKGAFLRRDHTVPPTPKVLPELVGIVNPRGLKLNGKGQLFYRSSARSSTKWCPLRRSYKKDAPLLQERCLLIYRGVPALLQKGFPLFHKVVHAPTRDVPALPQNGARS